MLTAHLALTAAALFTGAALYINVAEQPARLTLNDSALLAEWKPSYARGYIMQASLAILGFALGAATWWTSENPAWLVWPKLIEPPFATAIAAVVLRVAVGATVHSPQLPISLGIISSNGLLNERFHLASKLPYA